MSACWDRGRHARRRNRYRKAPVLIALLAIAAAAAAATPQPTASDRATASHSFDDVEYWSSVFDDPERDEWQKPKALIAALQLRPGVTVADLGAGTGYFSRHLADAVGADGTVLAIEVEPTLVTHLRDRAQREQTANVVPVLASTDNPRLPRGGVDVIFVVDTYHHLDHRARYLPQLRRALRGGGRVVVVDWKPGELPKGPPPDHKLPPERVIEEMRGAGFALIENLELLPYQYVLVFGAAGSGEPVSR